MTMESCFLNNLHEPEAMDACGSSWPEIASILRGVEPRPVCDLGARFFNREKLVDIDVGHRAAGARGPIHGESTNPFMRSQSKVEPQIVLGNVARAGVYFANQRSIANLDLDAGPDR